jgi:predicted metallo-beta-lactamase superfamily hydrolase
MSADNWTYCPKCQVQAKLKDLNGIIENEQKRILNIDHTLFRMDGMQKGVDKIRTIFENQGKSISAPR